MYLIMQGHDEDVRPAPDDGATNSLAHKAALVQDLLRDLELTLLPTGETPATRLLRELKQAWREFRDEALLRQGR